MFQIKALLDAGRNQSEIARTIGVHRSTICRELKRNVTNDGPAGNKYRAKPKHRWFTKDLGGQAQG